MVDFHRPGHIINVTMCYNGNRQIPIYVHSSNHTQVYCVSMHGIAFCSHLIRVPQTCCTCATHVFHVCHVKLVGNLYCSYIHMQVTTYIPRNIHSNYTPTANDVCSYTCTIIIYLCSYLMMKVCVTLSYNGKYQTEQLCN